MARPPKNLRHYIGLPADPKDHPSYHRWKPRRVVVEEEQIHAPPMDLSARHTSLPLDPAEDVPQDASLALPEPPPPGPGDDLRLPNPDRWAPERTPLPRWFWLLAVLMAVVVGLSIASNSSGPRGNHTPEPEFATDP